MPNLDTDRVRGLIGDDLIADRSALGDHVFVVRREGIHRVLQALREDSLLRFDMLMDLGAADRLMDHYARIREDIAFTGCARCQQERPHACGLSDTVSGNVRLYILHSIIYCQSGGNNAAR